MPISNIEDPCPWVFRGLCLPRKNIYWTFWLFWTKWQSLNFNGISSEVPDGLGIKRRVRKEAEYPSISCETRTFNFKSIEALSKYLRPPFRTKWLWKNKYIRHRVNMVLYNKQSREIKLYKKKTSNETTASRIKRLKQHGYFACIKQGAFSTR